MYMTTDYAYYICCSRNFVFFFLGGGGLNYSTKLMNFFRDEENYVLPKVSADEQLVQIFSRNGVSAFIYFVSFITFSFMQN